MIKKLLKFGLLYLVMLCINNLIWMKHPEYQQRPADFPQYVMKPDAYRWHPINEPQFYASSFQTANAGELHVTKRLMKRRKHASSTATEVNREFIEQMGRLENPDGNPTVMNRFGYMGKFQMGTQAFREVGVKMTPRKWKHNPLSEDMQDKKFLEFCAVNNVYLKNDIEKYSGKRIKGIRIHQANILAAAHGGIGRAHSFLASHGRVDRKDGNGTRISHYFRTFENKRLDLSKVKTKTKKNE